MTIEDPLAGDDGRVTVPGYCDFVSRVMGRVFRMEFVEYFRFAGDEISLVNVYGNSAAAVEACRSN